jgi:hypothetical protein
MMGFKRKRDTTIAGEESEQILALLVKGRTSNIISGGSPKFPS